LRISQDQQERYRQQLIQQQYAFQRRNTELERQRRVAQYRYQQRYLERLRQDQIRLQNSRYYDDDYYNNDAGYNTYYRYNRDGRYYETNQYGAQMLQRAVNNGYEEGYYAGQADREDGWRADYRNSDAYQDASYGYDSYYVGLDEYRNYFREGFRRGYEDGYYSRSQYGQYDRSSNKWNILGTILSQILNLQSF